MNSIIYFTTFLNIYLTFVNSQFNGYCGPLQCPPDATGCRSEEQSVSTTLSLSYKRVVNICVDSNGENSIIC